MEAMATHRRNLLFCSSCILLLNLGVLAVAEDLKLTDGRAFRDVRIVEVRPDGLIVAHRNGVVMADFEKLPKAMRTRYALDSQKASAFRESEAQARRATEVENRRLVAEYEQRKEQLIRARIEGGDRHASSFAGFRESQLTYQPGAADRAFDAGVAYVSEEIAKREEERIREAQKPETFWDRPFWKSPVVTFIGSLFGAGGGGHERGFGFNSEPRGWR
jgi:hypothetical protein